jgi:hypothetical protein
MSDLPSNQGKAKHNNKNENDFYIVLTGAKKYRRTSSRCKGLRQSISSTVVCQETQKCAALY